VSSLNDYIIIIQGGDVMQINSFVISIGVLVIGMILMFAGIISLRFKDTSSKKEWSGKTVMFIKMGMVITLIGAFLAYSYR